MIVRKYLSLFMQIFRFGLVGIIAASAHFFLVSWIVQSFDFDPLIANIYAFFLAVQISYWGHRKFTFNTLEPHHLAFPKLIMTQVCNLAANEILFYILLSFNLPYQLALIIVLSVLPIFTFLASKFWVFV